MPAARRRFPIWLFVSAAWLAPAVLAALKEYVQRLIDRGQPPSWRILLFEGGDWLIYGILTPAVFWLARRLPLDKEHLLRRLPLHLAASILLCAAWAGGGILLSFALFRETPYGGGGLSWLLTSLPFGVAVYFAVLGVEHAVFYFFQAHDRERQLVEARMSALRMQLQPHFLLNSLNAITVVVRDRDLTTATRMLDLLGGMLRRVMRTDRPPEVTLAEELDFVRQYLSIEEIRFPDRLQPLVAVDERLRSAAVPEFLLQPLVENAIRHGVARREAPSVVRIESRLEGEDLILSVTDDGPGTEADVVEGVGLRNTRERLATMYGTRGRLELARTPEGGTRVTARLPFHELEGRRA